MKLQELKRIIESYPDNTEVIIKVYDGEFPIDKVECRDWGPDGNLTLHSMIFADLLKISLWSADFPVGEEDIEEGERFTWGEGLQTYMISTQDYIEIEKVYTSNLERFKALGGRIDLSGEDFVFPEELMNDYSLEYDPKKTDNYIDNLQRSFFEFGNTDKLKYYHCIIPTEDLTRMQLCCYRVRRYTYRRKW